jgi:hypothetical protein
MRLRRRWVLARLGGHPPGTTPWSARRRAYHRRQGSLYENA